MNTLRLTSFVKSLATNKINLARPPTTYAARYQSFKTYHEIQKCWAKRKPYWLGMGHQRAETHTHHYICIPRSPVMFANGVLQV